jgi:hypothetical protein
MRLKPIKEICSDGTVRYILRGQLHREDGPALVFSYGLMEYWQYGKLHRTDGPARIFPDGYEEWHANGKHHRIDGPAIIWPSGRKNWYINNQAITEEVEAWMEKQKVEWPWDEETQVQFLLTFS